MSGAFSRHSTKSATTVISVKSAPETYNKALSSSNGKFSSNKGCFSMNAVL